MISNKLLSKKAIPGIVLLVVIVIGAVLYSSLSRKSQEAIPQTKIDQPPTSAPSISEEPETTTTNNPTPRADLVLTNSFAYSKNDQLFSVSEKEFKVLDKFSAADLVNESKECGTNKDERYFKEILSKYSADDKGIEYSFKYKGKSQDSGVWTIAVIPNKIGYAGLESFKNDFDLCKAGADKYPTLVSGKNLLFESSCGTGFDDNSGNPHGCDIVQQAVGSTIELR